MARKLKTDFIRAVLAFNPNVFGRPGTKSEVSRIQREIADYDARTGGNWYYDNLFSTIISVLKRMPTEHN